MPEVQSPVTPDQQSEKPSLNTILGQAKEAGNQTRVEGVDTLKQKGSELRTNFLQRVTQAREKARGAWQGVKEVGAQWKTDTVKYADITLGLATNSEVRAALGGFMQDKVLEARDRLSDKKAEITDKTLQKKDDAVARVQEGMRALWTQANEKLITPQVTKAREIAKNVRQTWGETKDAGREAADVITNYFTTQAENTRNGIRARSADVSASWNDILAKPKEIRASLLGGLGEMLLKIAHSDLDQARSKRENATGYRAGAVIIRSLQTGAADLRSNASP